MMANYECEYILFWIKKEIRRNSNIFFFALIQKEAQQSSLQKKN